MSESRPFLDLFSRQADQYAAARPRYPDSLFDRIAPLAPARRFAWDCATGNGQAASGLARHFDRVIATDASADQIRNATPIRNVEYRVATAEESGLADHSVDLVTVAQALHWLDHDRFYAEVRRVTVPRGIIAAWSYGSASAGDDLEGTLRDFEGGTLGPYWHSARHWVDEGYRTLPFPFEEIPMPPFELRLDWSLSQLGEYISSWSAVAAFRRSRGTDPVLPLMQDLAKSWGPAERTRTVVWPLSLRVGRVG